MMIRINSNEVFTGTITSASASINDSGRMTLFAITRAEEDDTVSIDFGKEEATTLLRLGAIFAKATNSI